MNFTFRSFQLLSASTGAHAVVLVMLLVPGILHADNASSRTRDVMSRLSAIAIDTDSKFAATDAADITGFRALGYRITRGEKTWITSATPACEDAEAIRGRQVYYVNNPVTLYGQADLPFGPLKSLTGIYSFQGDDVLIVYGYTPPPITYYSFTLNQKSQYDDEALEYQDTNSSIGLSINQENIKTLNGEQNGDFFALIITANYIAAEIATNFLNNVGVPDQAINYMYFPQRFTSWDTEFPDNLAFLTRLTFRTQEEADIVCSFAQQTPDPMGVLFFKGPGGPGEVEDADLMSWEDTLRVDSSEWDAGMDTKLDELTDNVHQHYEGQGYTLQSSGAEFLRHVDAEAECRVIQRPCNFDAPDALYGQFLCEYDENRTRLCSEPLPDLNEVIVVVGVNHHRFGADRMSTYTSLAVTRKADLQGIATIVDLDTLGSAAEYVSGTTLDPDDFFVVRVTRDCTGQESCMEVPWTAIPANGSIVITSRNYLDKETAAGPNPANFVPSRLLRFTLEE